MTIWDPTPVAGALISPRPRFPGAWFDAAAADDAVAFFPAYLRFTAGSGKDRAGKISSHVGKPIHLSPWQVWVVRQAFGWKRPDGSRLYRRVFVWVPRKNGKTEWAAGVSHIAMLRLGMPGGEVYSIAANADQAAIVFRAACAMAAMSPELTAVYEARKKSLYCAELHTVFQPLTGKAHGKHGLKCSVMIGDEAHEWKNGDLYYFVRQSMGAWIEPLEWIISTGGEPGGFGHELWDECEKICDGSLDDEETLVVMYRADPQKDDVWDPKVHARVNPNLGVSISADWFANEARHAKNTPTALAKFLRYHLNVWAEDSGQSIPAEHWAECTDFPDNPEAWKKYAERFRGRRAHGGIDLASVSDMNALVWLFEPEGASGKWGVLPRFWWPEQTAEKARLTARIPIEKWEEAKAFTPTSGNRADHDVIRLQVLADMELFDVQSIGIDPWNAHQLINDLTDVGVPLQIVKQNTAILSPVIKSMLRMVLGHEFDHGGHPVLKWQASNAVIKDDDHGNSKMSKKRAHGKIDGIAALVNALAMASPGAERKSYLASSSLLVLPL